MALGTADGQTQPDGAGGVHAVHHRLDAKLLRIGTSFLIDQRVAMKGGRQQLLFLRLGQQIAGQLFDGKAIEGQIVVERRITQSR